jgi:hypothetical protein
MMSNRNLGIIGVGLYVLQVLSSATDAAGNQKMPDTIVFGVWNRKFNLRLVAAFALWKLGARFIAL